MIEQNIVLDKSFAFAVRIVRLNQFLSKERNEFVMSRQLLRSGTSIGANITEANDAYSRNDFLNKMYIALKECSETRYWIELLYRTDYLSKEQYDSIQADCVELQKLLTAITKRTRRNLEATGRG